MESYAQIIKRLQQTVSDLKRELATSQQVRAKLEVSLAQSKVDKAYQDLKLAQLKQHVTDLEARIVGLENERDYYLDQANINLEENRWLWDQKRNNPYPDEKYNDD
jgi:cell division septum initiation protein DivIVA